MDNKPMTREEDEAWDEAERAAKYRSMEGKRHIAVVSAGEFCDQHDLSNMNIKKAFELGYMRRVKDELGL